MKGKTVVITGATSGIGEVAAEKLAAMGARIVLIARDRLRAEPALTRIAEANPHVTHAVHYADLSLLSEMKRVAAEITAAEPRIDVLVNNAGAIFSKRQETADGLEMTFALNHMAYFVVTKGLTERLRATPGARVVSTSSDAHQYGRIDFGDLQFRESYGGMRVYGTSKLCNILFTRALARRLADTGVTANCLHPGFVDTRFGGNNDGFLGFGFGIAKKIAAISPEAGARTIVYLASSEDVAGKTGGYYYKCVPAVPSQAAQNDADAERLWAVSEEIANG
jgi:NAD(P)-dependent dehydrogenase (short-subunit alcohol dehydrogenase family)